MKLVLAITFGVLTAAALGIGGYLGTKNYMAHQDLLKETKSLAAEEAELSRSLTDDTSLVDETGRMSDELDRDAGEIKAIEPEFSDLLTATGDSTTPIIEMVVSRSGSDKMWISYPFKLRLRGPADSVYSSMKRLISQVPLIRFDSVSGSIQKDTLNIRFEGRALFPSWENTADYLDKLN